MQTLAGKKRPKGVPVYEVLYNTASEIEQRHQQQQGRSQDSIMRVCHDSAAYISLIHNLMPLAKNESHPEVSG